MPPSASPRTFVLAPHHDAIREWCPRLNIARRAYGVILAVQPDALRGLIVQEGDRVVILPGTPVDLGVAFAAIVDESATLLRLVPSARHHWPTFLHGGLRYASPNSIGLYDHVIGSAAL